MALKKNAQQLFTDRDEPRKAFWDTLRKLEENPGSSGVITYYGEGGIGKSWLLRELKRNTEQMYMPDKEPVFKDGFSFRGEYVPVLYNLETSSDPVEILCQLRYDLYQQKEDLNFPLFDCAVRKYMELSGKKLAAPEGSGSSVLEKYESFLDTASMFIPGLGTLSSIYAYVKKGGSILNNVLQKIEDKHLRAVYKEYFEAISYSESVEDISDNIVEFFKTDLNNSDRDYSIVFFIDTFEVLSYNTGLKDQSWITEELAKNTSNCLWVFAGRNRIYKKEENEHLLGDLSKEDSLYYLKEKVGIEDDAINEKIYEISGGTPIFLDICVQNYKNEGYPSVEEFQNLNKELLLKRYIKYLSESERLVIRMMSSMSHWTDTDFREVFNNVHNNSFSQYNEAYNRVSRSTMIEKDNEDRYFLHRAVRAGIYEDPDYPIEVKAATLTEILKLYGMRAEEKTSPKYYFDRIAELIRFLSAHKETFSDDDTLLLRDAVNGFLPSVYIKGTSGIREMNDLFDKEESFLCHSELSKAHIQSAKQRMLSFLGKYSDPVCTSEYSFQTYEKVYGKSDKNTISALYWLVGGLRDCGFYAEALNRAEDLVERAIGTYGEEDKMTQNVRALTANILYLSGSYDRALELYQELYEISVKLKGENDRDTILMLEGIAAAQKEVGEYREALENGKKICQYYRDELGDTDPATITALNNLAVTYSWLGEKSEAGKIYQDVYERSVSIFGENHPNTVQSLCNIASVCGATGDHSRAIDLFQKAYQNYASALGEDHPRSLDVLLSLGHVYELEKEYGKAIELYQKAYNLSLKKYGETHLETIKCLDYIASLEDRLGHVSGSYELYKKILMLKENSLGQDHPDTLDAMISVAVSLQSQGNYEEAVKLLCKARELSEHRFGERNAMTIRILAELAISEKRRKRYDISLELYEKVLSLRTALFGEDHPRTLLAKENIAEIYIQKKEYDKSLSFIKDVFERKKRIFGEKHRKTLETFYNLAFCYSKMGDHEKALAVNRELYDAAKDALGENSDVTLNALYNAALELTELGRYEEALETIDKACDSTTGKNDEHREIALLVRYQKCRILERMKRYEEALEIAEAGYRRSLDSTGAESVITNRFLSEIGVLRYHLNDYSGSLFAFEKFREEACRLFGENDMSYQDASRWIAFNLYCLGEKEESLKILEDVYPAFVKNHGADSPDTTSILSWINGIRRELQRNHQS